MFVRMLLVETAYRRSVRICTFCPVNCGAKSTDKYTFQLPLKIPFSLFLLSQLAAASARQGERSRERNRKREETVLREQ